MPDDGLLVIDGVRRRFGGLQAVDDASFTVRAGSVTALIGPNGAGKTTLFNVVSGFLRPDAGRIVFEGRDIARRSPHAIARIGLVRTFQLTRVLAKMKVLDNMMLAAPDQPGEHLHNVILRPRRSRRRARARCAPRRSSCWSASAWRATPTPTRPRCRAASASSWSSPGR